MTGSHDELTHRDQALAATGAVFIHAVLLTIICLLATPGVRKHAVPFRVTEVPAPPTPAPVAMLVVSAPIVPKAPALQARAPAVAPVKPAPVSRGATAAQIKERQEALMLKELTAIDNHGGKLIIAGTSDLDRSLAGVGNLPQGALIGALGPGDEAAGGLGVARGTAGTGNSAAAGGALVYHEPGGGSGTRRTPVDPDAVQRAIQAVVHYPRMARQNRVEGRVVVRFRVDGTGRALDPSIVQSGGDMLDAAALEAVARAAPFRSGAGWVQVPVEFSLLAAP